MPPVPNCSFAVGHAFIMTLAGPILDPYRWRPGSGRRR